MHLPPFLFPRDGDDPIASPDTDLPDIDIDIPSSPPHGDNPAVAFIIGVSIVLLASILNAGGLNLTKLDHVRTSAIPKASRRKDWLRPLWLLGMILYILSQLIGSTLALRYLRAEYVAPLGATSLIFNFLFASLLVGTPVTNTDIYGTIVVILGVVGIVAFGSINSGLENGMDLELLKHLWGRAQWIVLYILMTLALTLLYIFAAQLERVLLARGDISAIPFAAQAQLSHRRGENDAPWWKWKKVVVRWEGAMSWLAERLETWTAAKDDKTIAWTLGIAWACCGGGLAGGCLVFARTSVQLISHALEQPSSSTSTSTAAQFTHITSILTFLSLLLTALLQIICLNRALRVYDSTLVVPVFYGVYTGMGALLAMVFNNEIERYHAWTLVLIFFSMVVLVSGVVLLTHKKPEEGVGKGKGATGLGVGAGGGGGHVPLGSVPASKGRGKKDEGEGEEGEALRRRSTDHEHDTVVWEVGDASDDDDDDDATVHDSPSSGSHGPKGKNEDRGVDVNVKRGGLAGSTNGEEGRGLMRRGGDDGDGDGDDDW